MKKLGLIIIIMVMLVVVSLPFTVMGEDSKEVLTLKRDLAQERVARIQSQLQLLQAQFKDGQEYLQQMTKELNELNDKLKVLEPKKEEPKAEKPKVEEKKK